MPFVLLAPLPLHEGHGNPALAHTLLHWLVEPVHLPLTLAVAAVLALAARGLRRRRAARAEDARSTGRSE
ncbi:MAG: hypothetical protein D6702_04265 [Planctomycetota bacterium]|nr:MAG: hypothetical protein D6702_04265 [Planctomycetota bacterium]